MDPEPNHVENRVMLERICLDRGFPIREQIQQDAAALMQLWSDDKDQTREEYLQEVKNDIQKVSFLLEPPPLDTRSYNFHGNEYHIRPYFDAAAKSLVGQPIAPVALLRHPRFAATYRTPSEKSEETTITAAEQFTHFLKTCTLHTQGHIRARVNPDGGIELFHDGQETLRFYGLGPQNANSSCWLDTTWAIFRLCNAGANIMDHTQMSSCPVKELCDWVTQTKWFALDPSNMEKGRNEFWEKLLPIINASPGMSNRRPWQFMDQKPRPLGPSVFDSTLSRLPQFRFHTLSVLECPTCGNLYPSRNKQPHIARHAFEMRVSEPISKNWDSWMAPSSRSGSKETSATCSCQDKSPLRKRLVLTDGPPERLAIFSPSTTNPDLITDIISDNIRLQWICASKQHFSTHYRWIGHVVSTGSHFYIHWLDSPLSQTGEDRTYCEYDDSGPPGSNTKGSIIGQIPIGVKQKNLVRDICGTQFLFYERVDYEG